VTCLLSATARGVRLRFRRYHQAHTVANAAPVILFTEPHDEPEPLSSSDRHQDDPMQGCKPSLIPLPPVRSSVSRDRKRLHDAQQMSGSGCIGGIFAVELAFFLSGVPGTAINRHQLQR